MAAVGAEALALGRLVRDFCWDWAPRNLTSSEHTPGAYRTAVAPCLTWLSSLGVTPETLSASDFGDEATERWLDWLSDERGNSPRTRDARLAAIRKLLSFVSRREPTLPGLSAQASAVEERKGPRTKVEGLTREAVAALMAAPDQATACGRRDLCVMATLYATACRVSELLALRVSDLALDAPEPHATLTGKGNKARVAYLPDRVVGHLRRHLSETLGDDPDPGAYVFWSRNHPRGTRPLSANAVTKLLQKHAAAARESCADVPPGVTPHRLRHARASHWLDDGMSVAQVSLMLGHASVQTTMDYLDVTIERLSEAMAAVPGAPEAEAEERRYKGDEARSLLAFCGMGRP